jgi:glycosyltransferase involved in cell wall biosynthesis
LQSALSWCSSRDRLVDGTRVASSRSSTETGDQPSVKLMYFAPNDVLVPRVDRQSIMRFCEAVAVSGWDGELVAMKVRVEFDEPTLTRDLFDVYGVRHRFRVTMIPSGQRQSRDRERLLAAWRATVYTAVAAWRLLAGREAFKHDAVVLYSKNYLVGLGLLQVRRLLGRRVILLFESHVPPTGRLGRFVLERVDGILPVSAVLTREFVEDFGLSADRIMTAHHGANLSAIEEARTPKSEARSKLGLPLDRRLAVYTGKVNARYREIDYLLETTKLLDENTEMVIVGGRDDEVRMLRQRADSQGITNVRFVGFVAPGDVYDYQSAADVLVTYYPGDLTLNRYRASPGKLFEYMAAQRPIVTADYPALRELLSPSAALFVEKDRPEVLAQGITRVLDDPVLGTTMADQAYADVQGFTWQRRAERVREFVAGLMAR